MNTESMAQPPDPTNWTLVSIVYGICGTGLAVLFKVIDSLFATRSLRKDIAQIKESLDTLFEYREKDKENVDRKFERIMDKVGTK